MEKAVNIKLPMLECLQNLIHEEFEKNPNARCMIFVEERQTGACLKVALL